MLDTRPTDFLNDAGYKVMHCDSPQLWAYFESRFSESNHIGSKFGPLPSSKVAELLATGERLVMDDLAAELRATGRIGRVRHTLTLDCPVGTLATRHRADVDGSRVLTLIEGAGTVEERVMHVIPTPPHAIPCTSEVTIEGGLFADGHSVGLCTLYPGHAVESGDDIVYLATPDEIMMLVHEMSFALDAIACVNRDEVKAMIHKARQMV